MYIYETKQLDNKDLIEIEKCGKNSLPIYYRYQHLESFRQRTKYQIWVLKDVSNLYGFIIFEIKDLASVSLMVSVLTADIKVIFFFLGNFNYSRV